MKDKEIRFFKADTFKIVKESDADAGNGSEVMKLDGYSAVFDKESENLGWGDYEVREIIQKGAFTKALQTSDCRALFNHNPNFVLGRESSGTLKIIQDEKGLRSIITLPDTTTAKDLAVLVARGDIREQSFGFTVAKDSWLDDRENKKSIRTIIEIGELFDISPVTYPAYPDTTIAKRSYDSFQESNQINQQNQAADENIKEPVDDVIENNNNIDKELDTEIINFLF